MNINKFEEKANEFLLEINEADTGNTTFTLDIISSYKEKLLTFVNPNGLNSISFKCAAESFDELFDKAYKILKSYAPKSTRERNKETETTEPNGNTINSNEI